MIVDAVADKKFNTACEYAIALIDWQREGGFVPQFAVDRVEMVQARLLNFQSQMGQAQIRPLFKLLEAFIHEFNNKPATPARPTPIVEDYAAIARGLRKLERK